MRAPFPRYLDAIGIIDQVLLLFAEKSHHDLGAFSGILIGRSIRIVRHTSLRQGIGFSEDIVALTSVEHNLKPVSASNDMAFR